MDATILDQLPASALRGLLPTFLASRLDGGDAEHVGGLIAHWTDDDYALLLDQLKQLGRENRIYEAVPRCRELARTWMGEVVRAEVSGVEHLQQAMDSGRTVIVTNHLSYLDATATDVLLANAGHRALADRIAYLAGPKVYQELFRLVAAASLHTLPVPQSNQLAHTEPLATRELARRAMASLEAGQDALHRGMALLFYPEGSRTRSGRLEPFLKATRRYLQAAEYVVPAAIDGTDRVMALDAKVLVPGDVSIRFAEPLRVGSGEARDALAHAHAAIASMLPEARRPLADSPRIH